MKCVVANCNNTTHSKKVGISYHRFPKDPILRAAWIKITGWNKRIAKHTMVCSDHFVDVDLKKINERTVLAPTTIPQIKLGYVDSENSTSGLQEIPSNSISTCCIAQCPSNQNIEGARLFPFPNCEEERARWLNAITKGYHRTKIKEGAAICQKHFHDCFIIKCTPHFAWDGTIREQPWRLSDDAIPTIFPAYFKFPSKKQKTDMWNFEIMCRTCSVKFANEEEKHFLFKSPVSLKENRPEIFRELISFGLKIEEEDDLPQQICRLCLDSFSTLIEFRDQCLSVETKFLEYYEKNIPSSLEFVEAMDTHVSTVPDEITPSANIVNEPVETVVINDDNDEVVIVGNDINSLVEYAKERERVDEIFIDTNNWFCEYYMDEDVDDAYLSSDNENKFKENNEDSNNTNAPNTTYTTCELCLQNCIDLKSHMKYIHGQAEDTNNTTTNFKLVEHFECNLCNRIFYSTRSVELHKASYHWQGPIKCSICQVMSKTMDDFREHKKGCGELDQPPQPKEHKCKHCGLLCKAPSTLEEHERKHTGKKPFLCDTCGLSFPYRQGFIEHVRLHTDAANFLCDICDKKFKTRRSWRNHRAFHASSQHYVNIKCKLCGKNDTRNPMQKHMRNVHNITDLFKAEETQFCCSICSEEFSDYTIVKQHVELSHPEKLFTCNKCDSPYPNRDSLIEHIQENHMDGMALKCGKCDEEFTTAKEFQEHIKLHYAFPYKKRFDHVKGHFLCDICDKKFTTRRIWGQHRSHHASSHHYVSIKCKLCGIIDTRNAMEIHMRNVHNITDPAFRTEETQICCSICSEEFSDYTKVKRHVELSHPENLLKCKKCDSPHPNSGSLLKHIEENHMYGMAAKCGLCDDEFTTAKEFMEHMKLHSEKRFSSPDLSDELSERFPRDPSLLASWLKITGWINKRITKHTLVCSDHFADSDIIRLKGKTLLATGAIPQIKLGYGYTENSTELQELPPISISTCCIPQCPSSQNIEGSRWFPFPNCEEKRAKWSNAITKGYHPTDIKEGATICHKHFDDCFIIRGRSHFAWDGTILEQPWRLSDDAIPTIFPAYCEVPVQPSKKQKTDGWSFEMMCRTCSTKFANEEEKHYLFKGPVSLKENRPDIFGELISFGLKIEEDDDLPQQICQLCLGSFSTLIQFRDQCRSVETKFLEYYQQNICLTSIEFVEAMDTDVSTVPDETTSSANIVNEPVETALINDDNDEIPIVGSELHSLIESAKKRERVEEIFIETNDWFCEYYMKLDDVYLPNDNENKTKENNADSNNTNAPITTYTTCELCLLKCIDLKSHMKYIHGQADDTKKTTKKIKLVEHFNCNLCNRSFYSTRSVELHKESYHWQGPIKCSLCQVMYKTMDDFREHTKRCRKQNQPPPTKYKCKHCGYQFKNGFFLEQHERKHTGKRPFLCDTCGLSFPYQQGFIEHVKGHTDASTANFLCDICDKKFTTRRRWRNHRSLHTSSNHYANIKCKLCEKIDTRIKRMQKHMRNVHNITDPAFREEETQFCCSICSEEFSDYTKVKRHVELSHPEKLLTCKKCDSPHTNRDSLLKHIQENHMDGMALKCGICDDEFTTAKEFQEHAKLHSEKRLSSPNISDELDESDSEENHH